MNQYRIFFLILAITAFASPVMALDAAKKSNPVFHHRSITVNGEGSAETVPDAAEVHVSVVAQAEKAEDAMKAASEKAKSLLKAIAKHGIEAKDVQTGTVSLAPVYKKQEAKDGKEGEGMARIVGYNASLANRLMLRDTSKIGDLIDSMVQAGADRFSGIRFMVTDQDKLIETARVDAMNNAKMTAAILAREAGAELGPIMRIEEIGGIMPQRGQVMAMAAETRGGVPVVPGILSVGAALRVVFALKAEK